MLKTISKTVKARVIKGRIEPLEALTLHEGDEVEITAHVTEEQHGADATSATAGAWDGQLDCEAFEDEVYENRLVANRPAVSL